ncbi:MAG: phosphoglycerate kinase [Patescibacteria group bacterium]|nr:phosphoglycerate kinase [Patescibacteria group bacterium]
MNMQKFSSLPNLENKRVFLRVDLNVPIKDKKVIDDYKIYKVIKTIEFLLRKKTVIIIATHLGKAKGRYNEDLSTEPIAKYLAKILDKKIKFIPEVIGSVTKKEIKSAKPGDIIFLENLRFKKGELDNDDKFAKELASLADIYINDALAVSHRKQASVAAIKKYLPSYSGLLLESELKAFERVLNPKKPLVIIMGGAKIKTKAPLIANLYKNSTRILLGGGLANSFLKYNKLEIGKSLCDEESAKIIKKMMKEKSYKQKIILPLDVVVLTKEGRVQAKDVKNVLKTDTIFDIGPATISAYSAYIKEAQTLIWNGPMGKFEDLDFRAGTIAIAILVASRSSGHAYGVVGGGETVAALRSIRMIEYVDFVSTAGGAMLSYLGGEEMPGL